MKYEELYKESEKEGLIEDLEPEFVKWDKIGKTVLGRFKGATDIESSVGEGSYKQYLFETDDGAVKFQLGAVTDGSIFPQLVVDGIYRIKFKGQEKTQKGFNVNRFEVRAIKALEKSSESKQPELPLGEEKK